MYARFQKRSFNNKKVEAKMVSSLKSVSRLFFLTLCPEQEFNS